MFASARQGAKVALALSCYVMWSSMVCLATPYLASVSDKHDTWTSSTGFTGGHVYSIAQTGDGLLWIGTAKGLTRFDGLSFSQASMHTRGSLANLSVIGLATDAKGHLWSTNGLQVFRQTGADQWTDGLPAHGTQPYQNFLVGSASNGSILYAAGLEGIASYDSAGPHLLIESSEMPGAATALALSANGTLWVGTHIGLFCVEIRGGIQSIRRVDGLADNKINCLLLLGPHRLLIGTDRGLWLLESGTLVQVGITPQLKTGQILALAKDLDDNVWIGTQAGLFKTDHGQVASGADFQAPTQIGDGSVVTALYADHEGDMWVGGLDRIERYRACPFTTYSVTHGLASENPGPIYVDEQGRTWFGPSTGGLVFLSQDGTTEIAAAGLRGDGVYSIAGGGGDIWVGRKHGGLTVLRLRGSSIQPKTYTSEDGLAENAVYSVYRGPDGTIWAGTLRGGLSRLQHGEFRTFTTRDGLLSDSITAISGGRSSTSLFVGTPNGLNELRDEHWITYTSRDGLPPGPVDSLFLDKEGTLWIGTAKGIAFLRSGNIHVPMGAPAIFSEEVLGVAQSAGGWLWISTPSHVVRVQKDALLRSRISEGDYREYGPSDGLDSAEGVKRSPSVVEDQRGQVWFSLNRGISVVNPAVLLRQSSTASIHLEAVLADDKTVPLGSRVRIRSATHRVTFRFASISLTNPDLVRYRYRMDGFDSAWSAPVALREANYTNIPPGNLRFRVIARNADGPWSPQEASIDIEVEPAYWQTRWFQLSSLGAVLLLGFGVYRLRVFQLTRQLNLRFEERLAERTRISRELHDTLLQNLTGLALQISGTAKLIKSPAVAAERMQQLKQQAEDCVRETRQSVWDIRSGDSKVEELASAIRESGEQLTAGKGVRFVFASEGKSSDLSADAVQHLLRIAREAIGNAVQHAAATEIHVKLVFTGREIQLVVSDDGKGFDVATKKNLKGHFGLNTMTERAAQIGAKIQFSSGVERGTSVSVTLRTKGR